MVGRLRVRRVLLHEARKTKQRWKNKGATEGAAKHESSSRLALPHLPVDDEPMHKIAHLLLAWLAGAFLATAADVLIVADEFPAMEVLATQLKTEEKLSSQIIKQTEIPSDIAAHKAVVVYSTSSSRQRRKRPF